MRALVVTAAGTALAVSLLVACGDAGDSRSFGLYEPDGEADGASVETASPATEFVDGGIADSGADGRDGRPPFDGAAPTVECAVSPCMTSLIAGDKHYCATASDGVIRCWGEPGALGPFIENKEDPNAGATPVVLTGLVDVIDIAAKANQTCVVRAAGGVDCFGPAQPTPVPIENVSNAKKLALGDQRSCVVKTNGELFCWGYSWGWGSADITVPLAGEQAVAAAPGGQAVAFAIGSKGTLFSWGSDPQLLGRETPYSQNQIPAPVAGISHALQVATSNGSVLALGSDGRLFGWGANTNGVLGLGAVVPGLMPEAIDIDANAWPSQMAISASHSCARMTDGSLFCWSSANKLGQLGYEAMTGVYVPTKVTGLNQVVAVAVGNASTCILVKDGSVQCWGDNAAGQLGQGTRDGARHTSPLTVHFN